MNPIDSLFQRLRAKKKKAFIPFVTAGDPDLAITEILVKELAQQGASLIEIGFPYSDPIADGRVIQASYTRALNRGLIIQDIFQTIQKISQCPPFQTGEVPLVGMVSFSLVHHRGPEEFVRQAKQAGLSGVIVPDLPVEESGALNKIARSVDLKLIHLVTPTTSGERTLRIIQATTGFLYCVSVTGITGERKELPVALKNQLCWLRTQTNLPLCVGFGISSPGQVRLLKEACDGIIVGSALVRRVEQAGLRPIFEIIREIGEFTAELVAELNK
jgi:tryptophan synthase alpha chain